MTKNELLNTLFEKYNLVFDASNPDSKDNDVYIHKHYKIITRGGIQKIEKAAGIKITIQIVDSGANYCNVSGHGRLGDAEYNTLASANEQTCKNGYYVEMAEKRCRSRLVLTLAGLYETGLVFGQDEMEDGNFETKARYKGG
ncbi:MAG TPA: hypothetical protein VGD26_09560 [Chitinophagaceae bacterium]